PLHSATHLARNGEPQSRWLLVAAREHVQHQLAPGVRSPGSEDAVEIRAAREPPPTRSRPPTGRATHQTVSRSRPFARLRFKVSRPARVCIRARKPCVRARLRFFG